MINKYCLTIDLDWAPDFAINYMMNILLLKRIKCTWFITHKSEAVEELMTHGNFFEFGIHPNFFPESTHGNNPNDVMKHMMEIVPNAKIVRTHVLLQSGRHLKLMVNDYGIEIDSSILLREVSNIEPFTMFFDHGS